jgi:hypothetical protein
MLIDIDVRHLVFPLIAGVETNGGFSRSGLAGTGFFVGRRGLALTAAHVVSNTKSPCELRAAIPQESGPMKAYKLLWHVILPNVDICVLRIDLPRTRCFATQFSRLVNGQEIETVGIPDSMLKTDNVGKTQIMLRTMKGYVSYGESNSIAASFSLPKGMSGAPLIASDAEIESQFVAGVFVGQTRGEQIEDLVEEVVVDKAGNKETRVERVSRVEYFARGDLLVAHQDHGAAEFGKLTLQELIARDIAE